MFIVLRVQHLNRRSYRPSKVCKLCLLKDRSGEPGPEASPKIKFMTNRKTYLMHTKIKPYTKPFIDRLLVSIL